MSSTGGPKSVSPRLVSLSPDEATLAVLQPIAAHLTEYAVCFAPALIIENAVTPSALLRSKTGVIVRSLVVYAMTGDGMRPENVSGEVERIATQMFCGPFALPNGSSQIQAKGLETTATIALFAALTRAEIALGEPVSTKGLAAVASLSLQYIGQMVTSGSLKAERKALGRNGVAGLSVRAKDAEKFLASRGVAGF